MNNTINKFLLAGDKFMPEMRLRQLGFTYSACGPFYENELQKTNQKEFRIEKLIKRKGDKLDVKWKAYNNSFNSWINKNDIIK